MKRYLAFLALSVALFTAGVLLHLDLRHYEAGRTIFGDNGDGFFNLWVMEHVVDNLAAGNVHLADGRIFWPDNADTYLWSDNLLVPSLGYAMFRAGARNVFEAYWFTALFMSLLGFAAYTCLFTVLFRIARRHYDLPAWSALLAPVFAYLASFSAIRLVYFDHFQNLSALWLFVLLGGILGYSCFRQRGYFAAAILSEVALLYSAPYFAILGVCVLSLWFLSMLLGDRRAFWLTVRENWIAIAIATPAFLFLLAAYMRTEKQPYNLEDYRDLAVALRDLVTPREGWSRALLARIAHDLPTPHPEKPAYLGLGLLCGLSIAAIRSLRTLAGFTVRWIRHPLFWILCGTGAVCMIHHKPALAQATAWITLTLISALLLLHLRTTARLYTRDPVAASLCVLGLAAVITYGLALGPSRHGDGHPDGSLWGLLSALVPGVIHMRAIGRLAVVGQGILLALLLLCLFRALAEPRHRPATLLVTALLIALQLGEQVNARASQNHYDIEAIQPTAGEDEWFRQIRGPLLVLPTTPFHRNAVPMLYFNRFPGIILMNGYSGRATATWDRIMQAGQETGEGSEPQIRLAEAQGARYIVATKWALPRRTVKVLRASGRPILFENDRFMVLQGTRRSPPGRQG
jgi:hypothetical protein